MATLTQTAYVTRKAINIGLIVLAALFVLRLAFGLVVGLWNRIFPPPPPAATLAFGQLPYPAAQNDVSTPSAAISYSLETADGGLPAMPATIEVFFMPQPGPTFGSFDKMKALAAKIGFADVPVKTSSTAWRFTDAANPLRTLDIDEVSGNFRLTYNFLSDLSLFNDKNFSSQDQIAGDARSFFSNLGLLPADIATASPTLSYFKLDSGALIPTTSLSDADAVGVTLNRADVEGLPVVSPDPNQGLVSVLFSGSNEQKKKILEARYFYTPVDQENFATYPAISTDTAFNNLKSGKAIYASLATPTPTTVTIRKVYLAYLDPYPSQSFLQPVLVFSDEKSFMAYVPVVNY
ncbi:MAG: hypothetical protein M1484_00050 [Patescibacteria group bacterium]|nr:hypothetical protein [Patescibacteria group bacterium]MCL5431472.1 hypothetical protein [Patescibacteria group bacterium]